MAFQGDACPTLSSKHIAWCCILVMAPLQFPSRCLQLPLRSFKAAWCKVLAPEYSTVQGFHVYKKDAYHCCYTLVISGHSINRHKSEILNATCKIRIQKFQKLNLKTERRMVSTGFHTPSLGDEPSYQAVKPPNNPLSPYAFFFKVDIPFSQNVNNSVQYYLVQETQTSIKQQQPDANFESVSKIVETMWQSLDETAKEKYK